MSEFYTVNDAAKSLGKSRDTVLYHERCGNLRATRTAGGMRLFRRGDVEQLATRLMRRAEQRNAARSL
jgi:excisionase family DNA binding protein